jgi:hypothetical protein
MGNTHLRLDRRGFFVLVELDIEHYFGIKVHVLERLNRGRHLHVRVHVLHDHVHAPADLFNLGFESGVMIYLEVCEHWSVCEIERWI